jgi:hypothetical protein
MDIPNFSNTNSAPLPIVEIPKENSLFSLPLLITVVVVAITVGFWLSRINFQGGSEKIAPAKSSTTVNTATSKEDVTVGKVYGNDQQNFKDKATGKLESGGINGEGTHTLVREGKNQNAALTSSIVDLDLFVGKKVEIQGETNSSRKAGWFLDVGNIKVLE